MVLAYHVIFGVYGFWLPNDPRGSWSEFVGAWELFRFGSATKTDSRRSVAQKPHDRELRLAAKQALKFPPVHFTGLQARAVGRGFGQSFEKGGAKVWACSILPEHVHLVVARQQHPVEQTVRWLKTFATRSLLEENMHPFAAHRDRKGILPSCWAGGEWKVFLDTVEDIERAVRYVEENPIKEGKPGQQWPFVTSYVQDI